MEEKTSTFPIVNDRYQILNTISSGGMAVIYRAKDIVLDREIALKILKKDLSKIEDFRDQFSTEAKASARLSHINIITTYDFGLYGDRLFIAMELIDGYELKDIIEENDLSLFERIDFLKQAITGLAYAHNNNIIHCDIKPQNMLITKEKRLKLTDFGISRALDTISRKNNTDEIWGSPYYIAPEIAGGSMPTPAADVYSMGIVMYEVLTKKLPYTSDEVLSLIEKHQEEEPVPPAMINPEIPKALNSIVLKAIRKDPKKRYPNASVLLSEIETFLSENKDDRINASDQVARSELENDIVETPIQSNGQFDWKTILLSFLAVIMVGGLIPFWLFIYYSINR